MNANQNDTAGAVELLSNLGVKQIGQDSVRAAGRGRSHSGAGGLCGACGLQRVCVTADGIVQPCIMSRQSILGTVYDDSLDKAVNGALRWAAARQDRTERDRSTRRVHLRYLTPDTIGPLDECIPNGPDGCPPEDGCAPGDCAPDDWCPPDKKCAPEECTPNGYWCPPNDCSPDPGPCGPDRQCGPRER